jgi:hypothetical protein
VDSESIIDSITCSDSIINNRFHHMFRLYRVWFSLARLNKRSNCSLQYGVTDIRVVDCSVCVNWRYTKWLGFRSLYWLSICSVAWNWIRLPSVWSYDGISSWCLSGYNFQYTLKKKM